MSETLRSSPYRKVPDGAGGWRYPWLIFKGPPARLWTWLTGNQWLAILKSSTRSKHFEVVGWQFDHFTKSWVFLWFCKTCGEFTYKPGVHAHYYERTHREQPR